MNPLVSDLVFNAVVISAIAVSLGAAAWQLIAEWVVRRELRRNK